MRGAQPWHGGTDNLLSLTAGLSAIFQTPLPPQIEALPEWAQLAFAGYKTLNRIQVGQGLGR